MTDPETLKVGQVVYLIDGDRDTVYETEIVSRKQSKSGRYSEDKVEWRFNLDNGHSNSTYGSKVTEEDVDPEYIYLTEAEAISAIKTRIKEELKERHQKITVVRVETKKV